MNKIVWYIIIVLVVAAGVVAVAGIGTFRDGPVGGGPPADTGSTSVDTGTDSTENSQSTDNKTDTENTTEQGGQSGDIKAAQNQQPTFTATREIMTTDGTKHSIPLDEILEGGPGKDGIPSIDNPKFISVDEADFLEDESPGLGMAIGGDVRFYPYQILVWHEIANDTVAGKPLLVTYCPLCATGIVFDRTLDGEPVEFGVSGKLWQSNLLMYNRGPSGEEESLWSQVLGEAVVGSRTGERLAIINSDIVRFGKWKQAHPDTKVLSRDTGTSRPYGNDPYGSYYESNRVSFGAEFADDRLHPKAFVMGIEVDGRHKAYHFEALPQGKTVDTFAGREVVVEKDATGRVDFKVDGTDWPHVSGFWFSWVAVHPDTELFR